MERQRDCAVKQNPAARGLRVMAKLRAEIRVLDVGRLEAINDLINELLDTIQDLRLVITGKDDDFEISEIEKERKKYIDRFANIITDEK